MKILNSFSGLLTNVEVYELLRQRQTDLQAQSSADEEEEARLGAKVDNIRRKRTLDRRRKALTRQALAYFETTATPHHTSAATKAALKDLSALPFKLTALEKLQLVNLHARSEVDVHVMVSECDSRLPGDDDAQRICDSIEKHLGALPDLDVEEEAEQGAEEAKGGGDEPMQSEKTEEEATETLPPSNP